MTGKHLTIIISTIILIPIFIVGVKVIRKYGFDKPIPSTFEGVCAGISAIMFVLGIITLIMFLMKNWNVKIF